MGFSHGYGHADDDESRRVLSKALSLGCLFWDSAAIYGDGHNETLIGELVRKTPGGREKIFISSKCGLRFDGHDGQADNSKEHIEEFIEDTTRRFGFSPDLYYLHRIEPGRDLKESIGALNGLKKAGKVKYIGLSECSASTLRKACESESTASLFVSPLTIQVAHIDALQIEYSPWFTDHEQNGLIDAARELGVTIVAYSPLGKGVLTGKYTSPDSFPEGDIRRNIPRFQEGTMDKNMRIVNEFKKLADKKGCTPGQLSLAWVIAQGAIPIPGTRQVGRLEENFGATDVELTKEELVEIKKLIEDAKPVGARYASLLCAAELCLPSRQTAYSLSRVGI